MTKTNKTIVLILTLLFQINLLAQSAHEKNKRIELFFTSKQVYNNGQVIDNFKRINYNREGDTIIVRTKSKKIKFSKNSIWGYKIYHTNGATSLYRRDPEYRNWYSVPGIYITQVDSMTIYSMSGQREHLYFSKNLDSEIISLGMSQLQIAYKDNKIFLELINKIGNLTDYNLVEGKRVYTIVKLYKESLGIRSN